MKLDKTQMEQMTENSMFDSNKEENRAQSWQQKHRWYEVDPSEH